MALDLSNPADAIMPVLADLAVTHQVALLCGLLIASMMTANLPPEAMDAIAKALSANYRHSLQHKAIDDAWGLPQGRA